MAAISGLSVSLDVGIPAVEIRGGSMDDVGFEDKWSDGGNQPRVVVAECVFGHFTAAQALSPISVNI